jgi:type I restriction enzyme S subunit
MGEWKEYKLKDVAEVQTGPFGSQLHQSDYKSAGTPIITVEHLGENKILHQNLPLVGHEDKERLSKYLLEEGDIVFSRVGSVDRRAYVSDKENGWMFSGRCLRVRANREKVHPRFLSFYFGQESFKEYIRMIAVGATMPSINTDILSTVAVTLPALPEQKSIASILSSLDDKIDLLHRQNKTLETLAETLFRQWFVEETEEGWGTGKLGDFGKIICGKTPSKKIHSYFGGKIPFIKIPDMHGKTFIFDTEDTLTEEGANSQQNKFLPPKSICVSCIATVGLVTMNAFNSQTNQQINSIIPSKEIYRYFLYLKLATMKNELLAMASGGTATDNLNTGDFSNIDIIKPDDKVLELFHNQVQPNFDKIFANQIQIRTLTRLRDTLLPKLMSGEVRVKAA